MVNYLAALRADPGGPLGALVLALLVAAGMLL